MAKKSISLALVILILMTLTTPFVFGEDVNNTKVKIWTTDYNSVDNTFKVHFGLENIKDLYALAIEFKYPKYMYEVVDNNGSPMNDSTSDFIKDGIDIEGPFYINRLNYQDDSIVDYVAGKLGDVSGLSNEGVYLGSITLKGKSDNLLSVDSTVLIDDNNDEINIGAIRASIKLSDSKGEPIEFLSESSTFKIDDFGNLRDSKIDGLIKNLNEASINSMLPYLKNVVLGLDFTDYNKLKDKDAVLGNIISKAPYNNIEEISNVFYDAVTQQKKKESSIFLSGNVNIKDDLNISGINSDYTVNALFVIDGEEYSGDITFTRGSSTGSFKDLEINTTASKEDEIFIKIPGYKSTILKFNEDVKDKESYSLSEFTLYAGDLNGDNIINTFDINDFSKIYGLKISDENFDNIGDYNNDGVINIKDLYYIVKNYEEN